MEMYYTTDVYGDTLQPQEGPQDAHGKDEASDPSMPTPKVTKGRYGRHKGVKAMHRASCHTPLREWLDAHNLTAIQVAKMVGCSLRAFHLWTAGQAIPSLVYAYRLDEVTGGAIPPASWLGTELGKESWIACGGKL